MFFTREKWSFGHRNLVEHADALTYIGRGEDSPGRQAYIVDYVVGVHGYFAWFLVLA